ncbi:hypothetical protein LSAT2_027719 [Lamellibrachia satsuma]|nr:hypothetical protein LSAT2_027719 [Lamellibrachia satsuma]
MTQQKTRAHTSALCAYICTKHPPKDLYFRPSGTLVSQTQGPHSETGNACFYIVPGMQGDTNIEYFRVLRVAYTIGQKMQPHSPEHLHHSTCPISYETFTPAIVRPRHGKSADRMEKMKETTARIAEFLKSSLADVLCVETVINPLEMVQSDAGGDASKPEHEMRWLLTTRLFITGPIYQYDPEFGEKLAKHSIRHERRKRDEESGHQPIFLRHVVTRRFKNRMLVAAVALTVAMTVIVVLSVVYSNV